MSRFRRGLAGIVLALAAVGATQAARAQTLDSRVVALTNGYCAAMGIPLSSTANPGLGPNLGNICRQPMTAPDFPPGYVPPTVAGGEAGSLQPSNAELSGVAAVERRKEKRRRERKDDAAALTQSASLLQVAQAEETYLGERLTAFVSVDFEGRDKSVTPFAAGYDAERLGATLGADYRATPSLFAGLALNAYRMDGDFTGKGDFHTDSLGIIAYGIYAPESGYFADFTLGGFYKNYRVTRFISGVYNSVHLFDVRTDSDTEGYELSSRLTFGKDFHAGRFTFGPRVGVNYQYTHIDGVEEKGTSGLQLVYAERSIDSLQSVVGLKASVAFSTGAGVLSPQISGDWVHEFKADQQSIDVRFAEDLRVNPTWFSFQTDNPDRDFYKVRAGVVMAFPGGIQGFVEARTILGHDYFDGYGGAAGLRFPL